MTDDADLLAQHHEGSPDAFAAIVRRHADWLSGVARRRVGNDAALADDVVQATFLVLVNKSRSIGRGVPLSAWLFRVACNISSRAVRERQRRTKHERQAAMTPPPEPPSDEWAQLAPLIDALVEQLKQDDREAILLRFYRQQTYAEVGQALGVGEEAARKRVDRAIERLRDVARRRGIPMGAATFAALLAAGLMPTPATAGTVALAATAACDPTIAGSNAVILAKGAVVMAISTKTLVATIAVAAALAATAGIVVVPDRNPKLAAPATAPVLTTTSDDSAVIGEQMQHLNAIAKAALPGYRDPDGQVRFPPTLGTLFEDTKKRTVLGTKPDALALAFMGPNPGPIPADVSAAWIDAHTSLVFVMRDLGLDPTDLIKQRPNTIVVHTPLDRPLRDVGGREVVLVVRVDGRVESVALGDARPQIAAADALAAPIRLDVTRRATMSHMLRVALAVNAAAAASDDQRLPKTLGESFPFINKVNYPNAVDETAYLTRSDLDRVGGTHEPTAEWIDANTSYDFLAAGADLSRLTAAQREVTAMLHTRLDAPLKNRGGVDMFLIAFLDGHVEEFRGIESASKVIEESSRTLDGPR